MKKLTPLMQVLVAGVFVAAIILALAIPQYSSNGYSAFLLKWEDAKAKYGSPNAHRLANGNTVVIYPRADLSLPNFALVTEYDQLGHIVWETPLAGLGGVVDSTVDASGNIFVLSMQGSAPKAFGVLQKINPQGQVSASLTLKADWTNDYYFSVNAVRTDYSNIYVVGSETTGYGHGLEDLVIWKFAASTFGSVDPIYRRFVSTPGDVSDNAHTAELYGGTIYIAGTVYGSVADEALFSVRASDGGLNYVKTRTVAGAQNAYRLVIDPFGTIYLAGTADQGLFLSAYARDGSMRWHYEEATPGLYSNIPEIASDGAGGLIMLSQKGNDFIARKFWAGSGTPMFETDLGYAVNLSGAVACGDQCIIAQGQTKNGMLVRSVDSTLTTTASVSNLSTTGLPAAVALKVRILGNNIVTTGSEFNPSGGAWYATVHAFNFTEIGPYDAPYDAPAY